MKVVDLHCDTLMELRRARRAGRPLDFAKNDCMIDLEKLQQGDYLLQCFAMYTNLGDTETDPLVAALEEYDELRQLLREYPDAIAQVKTWKDLEENRQKGRISALLTVEEGGCCHGSLGVLRQLYEMGARIMTLTWNYENELAWPNVVPDGGDDPLACSANAEHGLKEKGFEFLAEMEKLGIIADVSHLSDAGFWDIYHHCTRPFLASHSNARSVCGHVRNLTDEMIRAIAEKGGIVGLNYCGGFLEPDLHKIDPRSTVSLMATHAEHFRNIAGTGVLALGSDFDGIGGDLEMYDCSCLPLLEQELHRRHFSDDEIEKIFHGNALRLLKEFLPAE